MKRIIATTVAILVCLAVGLSASLFQSGSIATWYPTLTKSELTPPDLVFPIAWGVIYVLMGVSIGITWNKPSWQRNPLARLFVLQLLLNFLWSINFFYLRSPFAGLVNIVMLDLAVIWYVCKAYRVKKLSALLFVPYLIWLAFATYLNLYILINN